MVAGLASQGRIDEWTGGLLLGLSLWVGSRGGDWLVKLLVVALIVSVWQ